MGGSASAIWARSIIRGRPGTSTGERSLANGRSISTDQFSTATPYPKRR
jgi:hypothetical protein